MNVAELFNNNNNIEDVNPKNKKEKERLLMEQRTKQAAHNAMLSDLQNRSIIDAKTAHKYSEYGLTWSPRDYQSGALDAQLADAQSNWAKAGNAIRQTLVAEIGLGTAIAFSDLVDIVINAGMSGDNDYTNPVTNKLIEWQEAYKNERAPIYSKPGAGFDNGTDFGWWMQNILSIASSLTLLIPSMAATKMLGLGAKLATKGTKALRGSKAAKKWARATDAAEEATKANRFLLSADTAKKLEHGVQNISNAVINRTLENYQESRQVYEDMYDEVKDSIDKMTDDEYRNFIERNANTLAGVDINNKEAVAKKIAKESADTTFKMDYANIGFDILQMFALRNMTFRGFRDSKLDASARRLNKNANKYFGQYKSLDELKEIVKKQSFRTKAANFTEDALYAGLTVGFAQATEGMEEAINYIASQEGMHIGHTMIGMVADGAFSNRIWQYAKAPELWESAFWGVAGGITFQQGASLAGRANMARNAKKQAKKNQQANESKTGENTELGTWREYWETPDTKRVKASIENRIATENNYRDIIKKINDGFNPFANDAPIKSNAEAELLKQRALNYRRAQLALNAMDSGTMGILKAYLQDSNVKKAIVEQGIMSEEDATKLQTEDIRSLEALETKYNLHAKNLKQLSKQLADDEGNQIPLDYLQIMARNNMEYELILDDYNITRNATLQEVSDLEKTISKNNPGFANDIPAYKAAIDLTWGITRLGELEAEKKQLKSKKVNKDNIFIIERLTEIDKQIKLVRDKIYNAQETQKLPRLLFAIENSMSAIMNKEGKIDFDLTSKDYIKLVNSIDSKDKEILEKIDERLVDISDEDLTELKLIRDSYNRIMNPESDATLHNISSALEKHYVTLTALDYHIKDTKNKMIVTANQMRDEAYEIHNVLNAVRRAKIANASNIILDLASKDKYGVEPIRKLLAQSYRGEALDFSGLNMKPNEEEQLKDAFDTINFGNRLNKSIYHNINAYLDKLPAIEAANEIPTAIEGDTDTNDDDSTESLNPAKTLDDEAKKGKKPIQKVATKYDETTNDLIDFILANKESGYIEYNKDGDVFSANVTNISDDGSITITTNNGLPKKWIKNTNLFTIDSNVDLTTDNYTTETTIVINESGEIVDKGRIVSSETAVEHGNSSTGEQAGSNVQSESSIDNKIKQTLAQEEEKEKAKEQVKTVPNASPIEDKEPSAAELGYIPGDNAAIEESQQLANDALKLIGEQIVKKKSIDELKNNTDEIRIAIANNLKQTHPNATNDDIIVKIDGAIRIFENMSKGPLELGAGNLMLSSLELHDDRSATVEAFKNAFNNFTEKIDVRVINNKKYINVENLCRYVGHVLNEPSIAKMIADNVIKFVNNNEDEIVVLDEKPNEIKYNIINNPEKPVSKDMVTNINLGSILSENSDIVKSVVDELNIGDKLKVRYIKGSGYSFYKTVDGKDVVLGGIRALLCDSDGRLYQFNDNWKTDILFSNNGIKSNLMDLFINWIQNNDSDENIEELNKIILQFAYSKNTDEKLQLVEAFEYNKAFIEARNQGYTSQNADSYKLLNGLAKIWRFVHAGQVYDGTKAAFENSITEWFTTKVAPSFKLLDELQKSNTDTVEITNITEGQIVISSDSNPIKDAIGSAHKGKIRIGICETPGIIRLAGDGINGARELSYPGTKQGRTLVAIPARNGAHAYVNAYGMPISEMDNNSNNPANKIKNQIFDAIKVLLENYNDKTVKDKRSIVSMLYDLLKNTIPYKENNKIKFATAYFVNNNPNVDIYVQPNIQRKWGNQVSGITITIREGLQYTNININNKGTIYITSHKQSEQKGIDEIIKLITSTIANNCKHNINFNFVKADNESTVNTGFARRIDGKFAFVIPTYKVEDGVLEQEDIEDTNANNIHKFDSYNSFLIDNNLIKVNTEVPIGESSNFNRFDNNFPQEITVKLSSSPVEEVAETTTTTQHTETSDIETYLNENKDNVDAKELTNLILGNEYLKNNPILEQLLPKNLIFINEHLGVNGVTNNTNEEQSFKNNTGIHTIAPNSVAIGRDFLDKAMSNNYDSRRESVRKLFHEELHVKLKNTDDKNFEVIRSIFDKFEASVNELEDGKYKDLLLPYTYPSKYRNADGSINRKGLEEFVVECLTSKLISGYLNTIPANNQSESSGFENLLEKLVDVVCKILGITEVNKQSLYYESLKAISQLNKEEVISVNPTETNNEQINDEFDGLDFSELNDTYFSELNDSSNTYASIDSYLNRFYGETYEQVKNMIDSGEIEIKCKLN